jgi:VanZ family protein
MRPSKIHTFKHWLPAILWMGVIFVMSTDAGSAAHTSKIIEPLVLWIKPNASQDEFELVHFIIRKLGHLSEYAVLALLVLRAMRRTLLLAPGAWSWQAAGVTQLLAAAYAATDEWHQSFIPGRTAALGDVAIDSSGALVGLMLIFLWHKLTSPGFPPKTTPRPSVEPSDTPEQLDTSKSEVR